MGLKPGRVVVGGGGVGVPSAPARGALRRRGWVEEQEETQRRCAELRAEAEATLEQARREAERLRDEARGEGQQRAEAAVAARWMALKQAEERWMAEREGDLLAAARLLAERLLLRELEVHPEAILDLARQALAPLRRARQLQFLVHPLDAEPLRQGLSALGLTADRIEVTLDQTAPRGAVRIRTELGSVRAELAPQLDRLLAALRSG